MWQPVAAARDRTPNAWWRALVAALAVVVLLVGFVTVAGVLSSADTSFVVAQLISRDGNESSQPKLVATGFGRATAPAETATLQIVIAPSGDQFSGSGFQPTPEASPDTAAGAPPIAAPVVDAMMSEGISREAITVVVSPVYGNSSFYGGGGTTGFRVDVRLTKPSAALLDALIAGAYQAASENGMYVSAQGILYGVSDCDALEQRARAAAIEDARRQAEQQAQALATDLGTLLEVSDAPPGTSSLASCGATAASSRPAAVENPYVFNPSAAAVDAPPYNPAQLPEAIVEFRVELTYVLPAAEPQLAR